MLQGVGRTVTLGLRFGRHGDEGDRGAGGSCRLPRTGM